MKKILFHLHCLRKGGAERVVVNLAEKFLADGYQVVIAIEHRAEDDYQISGQIQKVFVGLEREEEIVIKGNILYKMYGRISNFNKRIIHLRKLIQKEKPDVVVAFAKAPNYRALMAAAGLHIPVIASVRNDPKVHYSSLGARIFNFLLLDHAAGCVFQTQEALEFFSKKLQKKSIVILNPIHPKYLETAPAEERGKYIVNVGRMAEQKNQLLLIKAFEQISADFPGYDLRIYGGETDDGTKDVLYRYVKEKRLDGRVKFMGISDCLDKEIRDASAFILSSDYEGMPNVLMEAMAMGIPVIATDCPCGGPRTLIRHRENGMLVPVGSMDGMAAAIREILSRKEFAGRLGSNAISIREKANIDKIYQEWKEYVKIGTP